jgi:hypothetical protein
LDQGLPVLDFFVRQAEQRAEHVPLATGETFSHHPWLSCERIGPAYESEADSMQPQAMCELMQKVSHRQPSFREWGP